MEHFFATLGLGVVLFISTNIDDIFVLLSFFAEGSFRPSQIIAGQVAGISALFLLSLAGALLALAIAPAYVGLLGFAPLGLGLLKLYQFLRAQDDDKEEENSHPAGGLARIAAIALVTIANGGDNIGVYVPVFTTQPRSALVLFGIIFLLMTGLWCLVSYSLVNHPKLGAPIRRYAKSITPFVLIALGLFILIESRAYSLLLPA
jgi:cadmium resistance protein CadD (predicted permease)